MKGTKEPHGVIIGEEVEKATKRTAKSSRKKYAVYFNN